MSKKEEVLERINGKRFFTDDICYSRVNKLRAKKIVKALIKEFGLNVDEL